MDENYRTRINLILNSALEKTIIAQNIYSSYTKNEFLKDKIAQSALERCLNIISLRVNNLRRHNKDDNRKSPSYKAFSNISNWSRKLNHNYQKIPASVLWKTARELEILNEILQDMLGDFMDKDLPKKKDKKSILIINSYLKKDFTPRILDDYFAPYLRSISDFQIIIDEILENPTKEIRINLIKKFNPYKVDLGGAVKATELIRDIVIPWRREHAKTLAKLDEQKKEVEIEATKAEIEKAKLHIDDKHHLEIEKMRLENEKIHLEMQESKINMALKIIEKLSPNMSQSKKIKFVIELLKPLGIMIENPLFLEATDEEDENEQNEE